MSAALRGTQRWASGMLLFALSGLALADGSPDAFQRYLAKRQVFMAADRQLFDASLVRFQAANERGGTAAAQEAADADAPALLAASEAHLHELLSDLNGLLGTETPTGCQPEPTSNLESTMPGIDFSMLDGLRYRCGAGNDDFVVRSHARLLQAWLAETARQAPHHLPGELRTALQSGGFYTSTLGQGSFVTAYQQVQIKRPPAASHAAALLVSWTMDVVDYPPWALLVTLIQGDQVTLASQPLGKPLPEFPACKKRFDRLYAKDEQAAEAQFLSCYRAAVAARPELRQAQQQAQALLHRLSTAPDQKGAASAAP